ncbi:sulfotransferase family protein [Herbidospora cretacea]|uniref:sulfotransferase family protein n=1 Tax=Herbidospora cretacea TaxID=28444 RepID=UPI0007748A8F|nr:sulfotransferase [Herbidospora cretacea]
MGEPRVLYITGWLRSGSTMLGNVLGELPGVLHVGELHYLWQNGILKAGTNSTCGCGADVTACDLWSKVITSTGGDRLGEARLMTLQQRALLRTRHTRDRIAESTGRTATAPGVAQAVGRTAAIYRTLAAHGGERLIVDGSKFPAEAAALLGRADLDVKVLHMVRDPRATAFSYAKAKDYIDPMSPARSSGFWTGFNLASELSGHAAPDRYLRVRHEDLCRDPRGTLARVLSFAGLDDEPPADADGNVVLSVNHTVTGNPDRLSAGPARIRADERWRTGLPAHARAAATGPALPLLGRYGYPILT